MRTPRATIDFETRSACSIKNCGSWRYSLDSSTQPLCLAYRLPHWEVGRTGLWHPAFRHLGMPESRDYDTFIELMEWVQAGEPIEAHNAWFERGIWQNIMVPEFGWPAIEPHQWRCSASKAAACAFPRKLEDATNALRLSERKDDAGHKVMKKMAKPRKARKAEREQFSLFEEGAVPTLYFEDRHLMEQLFAYCRQDVLAEEALSAHLPDLSPSEQGLYLLDQTVNERGFQLDMEAVARALKLVAAEAGTLNAELTGLTNGLVTKATQRDKLKAWFLQEGLYLDNTQAGTLDELLAAVEAGHRPDIHGAVLRALQILRTLGRSSTAKYEAMQNWAAPADGRVRGGLLFHGATTGRWSGAGVQPHNFPKGSLKKVSQDDLWVDLKARTRTDITAKYRSVMEALSHGLRGAIVAGPGKQLYVADYASIEARVLLWVAGDEEHLNLFRNNLDPYLDMANSIYGYPCTKEDHPKERGVGKIAILGLGYQMGAGKFVDTCAKGGVDIDDEFSEQVVQAYRAKYWRVKRLWGEMENAAIQAVLTGRVTHCGPVSFSVDRHLKFLFCTLPSGRRLCYPFPQVRPKMTPWGEERNSLHYKGVNPITRQWGSQSSYGGMRVENVVQAIARDIMAEAMVRAEDSEVYLPILTIHDEIVAEAPDGLGSVHEFEALMSAAPIWAPDCPIAAEGWVGHRYHK